MTTLKQGDLIKDSDGDYCKVLEVCGEVVLVSPAYNHGYYGETYTESQLKESGYTWDTPAWVPSFDEKYWYPDTNGDIYSCTWGNTVTDNGRKNLLGIYKTFTLAEAALLEIKLKLGK